MKRFLLALPLSLACLSAVAAAPVSSTHLTPAKKAVPHKHAAAKRAPSAPADEYFGHQKLSILGLRNMIHDLNIRYDGSVQRAPMVMTVGSNLEDAMHAWDKKYPGDMWLGHNLFQLDQIYMRVPTPDGKQRTTELTAWITHEYHGTYYAKYLTHIQEVAAAKAKVTAQATVASVTPSPVPLPLTTSTPLDTAPAPELNAPAADPKSAADMPAATLQAGAATPAPLQAVASPPPDPMVPAPAAVAVPMDPTKLI